MSIAKFVNGGNRSAHKRRELHEYILDPVKTENQTLTGGYAGGGSVEAMEIINRLHHNEGGRQFMQLVVAPTSDTTIDLLKYLEFARYLPLLFPHHQSCYAVHTDTKHLHIHIVYNSVNFITGRKLTISPSGLCEIRRKTNGYLEDFGFDPILEGSGCILDSKDLPNVPGFSRFEIDESLLPPVGVPNPIDITEDPVLPSSYYNNPDHPKYATGWPFGGYETNRRFYPMKNLYPANPDLSPQTVPSTAQEFLPTVDRTDTLPTMSLDLGPKLDINASPGSDLSGLVPIIQGAYEQAQSIQEAAVNIDYAIGKKAYGEGLPFNVHVDASPHIHINLVGSPPETDYIDVDSDEFKDN